MDDELDRTLRDERAGAAQQATYDSAVDAVEAAVEAGLLGERFAGLWFDDADRLCIAVTGDALGALDMLRAATPDADVTVTVVAHSMTHLERLAEELIAEGERLHAPFNMVAVDPVANSVQVGFDDMDAPAARAMIERFGSEPVSWSVEPPATAV